MIILSIDSGLEKTGYAVFNKNKRYLNGFKYLSSGLIKTSKLKSKEKRLLDIYNRLEKLVELNNPHLLLLEQLFFFKNQKTAIVVSQAQGIVLLLAAQKNISIEFLTPLQIKEIITGYGHSDKKGIQKMIEISLGISVVKKSDDETDAIAGGLAYCYLNKNLLK